MSLVPMKRSSRRAGARAGVEARTRVGWDVHPVDRCLELYFTRLVWEERISVEVFFSCIIFAASSAASSESRYQSDKQ